MATNALVDAFALLPTSDARLRALEALMQTLSPYEWRAVHSVAGARTFQFDIIGHLPVELVAQIFSYLDTSSPYRLQPVSRQWCHILRSSAVLKKSLLSWGDTLEQDLAHYGLLELKAKSIHAFRHGQPKHSFKVVTHVPDHIFLKGDTLIWSDYHRRVINLFHLKTWKMYTLNGDARERVGHLFASDQIVGFTTMNNICYVSDLEGRRKKKFTVPNTALFQSVVCRDSTVACASILEDHVLVYIWNFDSQRGTSFTIASNAFPIEYARPLFTHKQGLALLLQPEDGRITIFTNGGCPPHGGGDECCTSRDADSQCTVWYSQFTYAGAMMFESEQVFHAPTWRDKACQYLNNPFIPVDGLGRFRVVVAELDQPVYHNWAQREDTYCWLQYDEHLEKFTESRPITALKLDGVHPTVFWWKDTFYSSLGLPDHEDYPSHPPGMSRSILAYLGTSEMCEYKPLILEEKDPIPSSEPLPSRDAIVLNGKYVIRAGEDCFHILCFEDNQNYPTADADFFDMGSVVLTDTEKIQAVGKDFETKA